MQVNAINAALGAKVADFRKAHGWSQAQLAEALGQELGRPIDATTITRLEQGKRPVPVHELIALSHVLTVEPTVFFKFLGPLDDVLSAARFHADGLQAKAVVAQARAEMAAHFLQRLEDLRRYRESRKPEDLATGVLFLCVHPEVDRPKDWREILLDAGIPPEPIDSALDALGSFPPDPRSDERHALAMEIYRRTTALSEAQTRRSRSGKR